MNKQLLKQLELFEKEHDKAHNALKNLIKELKVYIKNN
jgi:hypothetical protein